MTDTRLFRKPSERAGGPSGRSHPNLRRAYSYEPPQHAIKTIEEKTLKTPVTRWFQTCGNQAANVNVSTLLFITGTDERDPREKGCDVFLYLFYHGNTFSNMLVE